MIGNTSYGALGVGTNGVATAGNFQKAIAWTAEDGGAAITPWTAGSNECVYVIKGAEKLSTSSFPDVPVELYNTSKAIYSNKTTLEFPQLTIKSGAKGLGINADGDLTLNGGYTIPSGVTLPLLVNSAGNRTSSGTSCERNVNFINSSKSVLAGGVDSVVKYFINSISTDKAKLQGGTIVDSTLKIGSGNASAFKGKYVIDDPPQPKDNPGVEYVGRTHLKFVSATAFGDPTTELADAVTLGTNAYLSIGASVAQYKTRGITIAAGKKGGIEAASGEALTLTAPVTCGTDATFDKIGAGTVTLDGDCTGVSTIDVTEGTLVLGVNGQFANGLAVTVKSGATLVQNKYVGNIAVTCEEGGTYTKDIQYVVPYSNATGTSTPFDFTTGVPEPPFSFRLSEPIEIASFAPDFETNRIEVAKLPSGTTATVADFSDATEKTYGLPKTFFELEDKGSYKALVLVAKPVVWSTRDFIEAYGGLNTTTNEWPWSDCKSAHSGADYLLTNKVVRPGKTVFNGDSLTICGNANVQLRDKDGNQSRLDKTTVYNGSTIQPNHGSLLDAKLSGDLTLMGEFGSTVVANSITFWTVRASNGNVMRFNLAAELKGEGTANLQINDNCTTNAYKPLEMEISGLNTNYHGVILALGGGVKDNNVLKTDETGHMNVVIGDKRNLGGPLSEFTYNALHLTNYSMLQIKNDVTLDTENRGIYIASNNGGFITPTGTTLTIKEKLTLRGSCYKHGEGTLALGGDLELLDASAKKCFVREGAVKALADGAVAGLDMMFSDGAAIALDPDAEIENGFTGNLSTVNPGEKIALRLESRPADGRMEFTVPVCTVPTTSGDISELFSVEQPRGYTAQLVTSTVGECTRYSVHYRRNGFILTFR